MSFVTPALGSSRVQGNKFDHNFDRFSTSQKNRELFDSHDFVKQESINLARGQLQVPKYSLQAKRAFCFQAFPKAFFTNSYFGQFNSF
jgi:hypothetical protein